MTGHTPGPWKWRKIDGDYELWSDHGGFGMIIGAFEDQIYTIKPTGIMEVIDPDSPDARLIAAAPILLSACLRINRFFNNFHSIDWENDEPYHVGEQLRAAIKSATGETPWPTY